MRYVGGGLLKNSKGFSLVEILVALFLISGAALLISQFSTSYRSKDSTLRRSCESYTESMVSLVKEQSPYLNVHNLLPFGSTATNRTLGAGLFTDTRALPSNLYQDPSSTYQISDLGGGVANSLGVRLRNFQLIQGSVRTLAEMYNRFPNIACQFGDYARLAPGTATLPIPSDFINLPGGGGTPVVQFRIEPYDLRTGASRCALNRVFPGPGGLSGQHSNVFTDGSGHPTGTYQNNYISNDEGALTPPAIGDLSMGPGSEIATKLPNVSGATVGDPNIGLKFSVRMTYALNGQNYSCTSTQDFSYPIDQTAPATPDLRQATANSAVDGNPLGIWTQCGFATGRPDDQATATLQVGYDTIPFEPGVQLLCRDLSWIRVPDPDPNNQRPCFSGGTGLTGYYTVPHMHPSHRVNTAADQTHAQFLYSANRGLRDKRWVPCDQMRQCGESPNSVGRSLSASDNFYTLNYRDLPFGCHMDFEVVGVDTAGNRSPVGSLGFLDDNASREATPITIIGGIRYRPRYNEVYYPVCGSSGGGGTNTQVFAGRGTFCAPNAGWGSFYQTRFPNGYYTCRTSCCQGANCDPWD